MTEEGREARPAVDWTGLIGLRNVLVHACHRIEPELLWQAATVDIPAIATPLSETAPTGRPPFRLASRQPRWARSSRWMNRSLAEAGADTTNG